jgi:hypothetical protein
MLSPATHTNNKTLLQVAWAPSPRTTMGLIARTSCTDADYYVLPTPRGSDSKDDGAPTSSNSSPRESKSVAAVPSPSEEEPPWMQRACISRW